MSNRLMLACVCALVIAPGCGGGDMPGTDAGGGGTDTGTGGSDTGVDAFVTPGTDSGVDAFVMPGTDSGVDAFTPAVDAGTDAFVSTTDAGMTDGCELGNTYPTLSLHSVHTFGDLVVSMALAPGRDDIFMVQRGGRIMIMNPTTGAVNATPFLDVSSRLGVTSIGGMSENGLLGLAFHPDYATNGLFYIAYTARTSGGTMPYEDRLAVAMRGATPDVATFGSDIFVIPDPASNHNGGQLGFGPDGFLYYGVGDGGTQYDPQLHGQGLTFNLGKIHRFQVGPGIATYNPAPGNPFISGGGNPTIWAFGLRNPWRFSWDRLTGGMYIGDVGQDRFEEIDYLAPTAPAGANFQWSYCEGLHHDLCRRNTSGMLVCNLNYPSCASLTTGIDPIAEYPHAGGLFGGGGGASVVGGYVYRGASIPALRGAYLFADTEISTVGALRNCPGMPVTATRIASLDDDCQNPVTFGEDRGGELLISCYGDQTVYRIVSP